MLRSCTVVSTQGWGWFWKRALQLFTEILLTKSWDFLEISKFFRIIFFLIQFFLILKTPRYWKLAFAIPKAAYSVQSRSKSPKSARIAQIGKIRKGYPFVFWKRAPFFRPTFFIIKARRRLCRAVCRRKRDPKKCQKRGSPLFFGKCSTQSAKNSDPKKGVFSCFLITLTLFCHNPLRSSGAAVPPFL